MSTEVALSEVLGALSYALFHADDQAAKRAMKRTDWTSKGSLALYTWRAIEPGGSAIAKARRMRAITREEQVTREVIGTRCERGADIARMLDLPEPTADAIRALDEHWDGSGHPLGLRGEDIPLLVPLHRPPLGRRRRLRDRDRRGDGRRR